MPKTQAVYMRPVKAVPLGMGTPTEPRNVYAVNDSSRRFSAKVDKGTAIVGNALLTVTTPVVGRRIKFTKEEMALDVNSKVINFCKREGTPPQRFAESIAYTHANLMRRLDRIHKTVGQPIPLWAAYAIEWRTGGYIQAWEWLCTPQHRYWMRKKHAIFARTFERSVITTMQLGGVLDMQSLLAKKARALASLYNVNWAQARRVSVQLAKQRTNKVQLEDLPKNVSDRYEEDEEG